MNKTILTSIVIIVLVVLAGGYFIYINQSPVYKATPSNETNNKPNTNTPTTINPQPARPENLSASVSIKNFSFAPNQLPIKVGTTVTWTNNDSAPHQIKSDIFNSAMLSNGGNFQFTFSAVGEYDYFCSIHPSMKGKITITQ